MSTNTDCVECGASEVSLVCERCLRQLQRRWIIDVVSAVAVVFTAIGSAFFYGFDIVHGLLLTAVAAVFVVTGIKRFKKYASYRSQLER